MALLPDQHEVAFPVRSFRVFVGDVEAVALFAAEGEFGGAEHAGFGERGIHFQRRQPLVQTQPVDVSHHLARLVVIVHPVEEIRGLRFDGTHGCREKQDEDKDMGGFGHGGFVFTWL